MEIIFQELNRQLLWYHIIARFQLQFILFESRVRRLIRASSEIYNLVVFIFEAALERRFRQSLEHSFS